MLLLYASLAAVLILPPQWSTGKACPKEPLVVIRSFVRVTPSSPSPFWGNGFPQEIRDLKEKLATVGAANAQDLKTFGAWLRDGDAVRRTKVTKACPRLQ